MNPHPFAPLLRLHADEARTVAPELVGLAGSHGLWMGQGDAALPATPLLHRWTRLRVGETTFVGDVRARADEPLPFQDDVFRVVLLSHVLEHAPQPVALLEEAVRVLAPDGLLAITGVHAFSVLSPWLLVGRPPRPALSIPGRWRRQLARLDVQTYAVRRFGGVLPFLDTTAGGRWLGAGFVLLARKRRLQVTPLHARARAGRLAVPGLAPGAHRECA